MVMLQRRLLARTAQIAVSVDAISTTIEAQPDFPYLLEDWLGRERASRIKARQAAPEDDRPYTASGFFAASWIRDLRSLDQYNKEVDEYINECRRALSHDIIHHFARHHPAMLNLRLTNNCERNFSQVRVTADINCSAAIGLQGELLDAMQDDPPRLPPPPAAFGTPMGGQRSTLEALSYLPYGPVIPALSYISKTSPGWHVLTITEGVQRIEFIPHDLRPHEIIDLPPVPLIVKSEPGATLSAAVGVTATNADGKWDSGIMLNVSDSTFSNCWPKLLASYPGGYLTRGSHQVEDTQRQRNAMALDGSAYSPKVLPSRV
jgi:hypothetical protein